MNVNRVDNFRKAIKWIKEHTIDGNGIAVTSKENCIYPEVTGYYIPSLLQWGERELAIAYAKYLCSIQKEDGSWFDSKDVAPYVFDSAQILKGLVAIRHIMPEVDEHIIKGCDWILSNMQSDGRLITPSKDAWGDNEDFCSELIHIYCLSPIRDAGKIFDKPNYLDAVNKILNYYKTNKLDRIKNFSLLSHFYAYVMEGLYDLGEVELCRESMERLENYRTPKGAIPGLCNVPWVCSTGLFQLALVWYKLGELEKGNSLFYYGLTLQNKTGGWYGSYCASSFEKVFGKREQRPFYFKDAEISWANKYFLDALALKEVLEFDRQSYMFQDEIDEEDGRYILIRNCIRNASLAGDVKKICDIGCGKGRYLKQLKKDLPDNEYYAADLSTKVMERIDFAIEKKVGSITSIPYDDGQFDIVYTCEAFEHAINLEAAFKELNRITKKGGIFVIIDKPIEKLGALEIDEWEQWVDTRKVKKWAEECGATLKVVKRVPHDGIRDGLFTAWIVIK